MLRRKNSSSRMREAFVASCLALTLCCVLSSQSQALSPEGPERQERRDVLKELDLSEDTQKAIRAIRDGAHTEARLAHQRIELAEAELDALFVADELDEAAIRAKVEEISTLHGDAQHQRIDTKLEIASLLTAEQRRAFFAAQKRRGPRPGGPSMGQGEDSGRPPQHGMRGQAPFN